MTEDRELREAVGAWHRAEDLLYKSVLPAPELYTSCVRLVRATADSLDEATDPESLLRLYDGIDPERVAEIAEGLELPQQEFLDYEQVLDAAFYLRYQQLTESGMKADVEERVRRAREEGAEWVVLYDEKARLRGHPYYRRLEMHLPDGIGLYSGSELDLEKGRVYVLDPMVLDPENGRPQRGVLAPDPKQEFTTQDELTAAVEALRAKYSAGNVRPTDDRGVRNG